MPSSFRDPKTLSEWIELDYFRRRRRLWRGRMPLVWATLIISLVLIAWTFWPGNRFIYQAGPVSPAHAMFGNNCEQCHEESFQTAKRLWFGNALVRSVADDTCKRCHDGAIHHKEQTHEPNCASCHREHRGHAVLARVPDSHCTTCHSDLKRQDGASEFKNVSSLGVHPEFKLWRGEGLGDTGTIRFNHFKHLKGEIDKPYQFPLIPAERGVGGPSVPIPVPQTAWGERTKVTLDCNRCHQPDAAGRYMRPINYEQHCAECHPLSVQVDGEWKDEKVTQAADEFRKLTAPHESPYTIRAELRERFVRFVQENPIVKKGDGAVKAERMIPGSQRVPPVAEDEWNWANGQLQHAENILFHQPGHCRLCHEEKPGKSERGLPEYKLSKVPPAPWLKHGRFVHDTHRSITCVQCHEHTEKSRETKDVLLPDISSCKQCHHPKGGARADCVECHTYHDHSKEREWKGKLSIGDMKK